MPEPRGCLKSRPPQLFAACGSEVPRSSPYNAAKHGVKEQTVGRVFFLRILRVLFAMGTGERQLTPHGKTRYQYCSCNTLCAKRVDAFNRQRSCVQSSSTHFAGMLRSLSHRFTRTRPSFRHASHTGVINCVSHTSLRYSTENQGK